MNINLYSHHFWTHADGTPHSCNSTWCKSMQLIASKLKEKYTEVNFNLFHLPTKDFRPFDPARDKYCDKFIHENIVDMTMIVENDSTKKYLVISYWDKGIGQIRNWHDYEENCVSILASSGCHDSDFTYEVKENPKIIGTSVMGCIADEEELITELYRTATNRIIPEKLFFRGSPYLFREYLLNNDDRFDVNSVPHLSTTDFVKKLSQYRINMDINSVAEVSCRTAQILGLGQVLIRPKLRHKLKNELVDMFHYAEVKIDALDNYKQLADAYYDTFNRIKQDDELINFISGNARKYYEENCTVDAHVKIVLDSIDLHTLI